MTSVGKEAAPLTSAQARAGRATLGWTKSRMASACHIGLSALNHFESGRGTLHLNHQQAMRRVLEAEGVILAASGEGSIPAPLERRCLSRAEAARHCNVTPAGFAKWVRQGIVPGPIPGTYQPQWQTVVTALFLFGTMLVRSPPGL